MGLFIELFPKTDMVFTLGGPQRKGSNIYSLTSLSSFAETGRMDGGLPPGRFAFQPVAL